MKNKRKVYDAYLTIEASFIMPIVLLVLVLLIQWGFFCYEKSVSLQCCYLAALRASNEWELSAGEMETYAKEQAKSLLKERNLYPVDRDSRANVRLSGIEVELDAYMEVLFAQARGDTTDGWEWEEKKQACTIIPSAYIRKYHMIENAGGESDGGNQ